MFCHVNVRLSGNGDAAFHVINSDLIFLENFLMFDVHATNFVLKEIFILSMLAFLFKNFCEVLVFLLSLPPTSVLESEY